MYEPGTQRGDGDRREGSGDTGLWVELKPWVCWIQGRVQSEERRGLGTDGRRLRRVSHAGDVARERKKKKSRVPT